MAAGALRVASTSRNENPVIFPALLRGRESSALFKCILSLSPLLYNSDISRFEFRETNITIFNRVSSRREIQKQKNRPADIHSRRSSRLFLDIHRYSRINVHIVVAPSRGNARKALRKEEIRYREFGKPFVTAIDEQSAIYPIRVRSIRKKEERIINDQLIAVSGASNWRH